MDIFSGFVELSFPPLFLVLSCFIEISVFNANSVDPDQTPHSAYCLACLPVSLIWGSRHIIMG